MEAFEHALHRKSLVKDGLIFISLIIFLSFFAYFSNGGDNYENISISKLYLS